MKHQFPPLEQLIRKDLEQKLQFNLDKKRLMDVVECLLQDIKLKNHACLLVALHIVLLATVQ
jgi:hypothetical protein